MLTLSYTKCEIESGMARKNGRETSRARKRQDMRNYSYVNDTWVCTFNLSTYFGDCFQDPVSLHSDTLLQYMMKKKLLTRG